jgi:hypothetical protein
VCNGVSGGKGRATAPPSVIDIDSRAADADADADVDVDTDADTDADTDVNTVAVYEHRVDVLAAACQRVVGIARRRHRA